MKSISKLKDEARKHEQREEWEKAIQAYLQVIRNADEGEAEVELPLYNRVGDLCVRLGKPQEAVRHYEQAADRYAEAGLYNNAIALCNKALRYNPDRLELVRKLGQFSASQGFITDARRYFLDYAERQFNAGKVTDALNALEAFANVSDDPEIREMLGRQLHAHGRINDAVDELRRAHAMRTRAGETQAATGLRAEILAIDPNATMDGEISPPVETPRGPDLDLPLVEIEPPAVTDDVAGLETGALPGDDVDVLPLEIDGFDSGLADIRAGGETGSIEGLETTTFDFGDATDEGAGLGDLGLQREDTAFTGGDARDAETFELPEENEPDSGLDLHRLDEDGTFELPTLDQPEDADVLVEGSASASFDLPTLENPDDASAVPEPEGGFDLPRLDEPERTFDLPLLDEDGTSEPDIEATPVPPPAIDDEPADEATGLAEPDSMHLGGDLPLDLSSFSGFGSISFDVPTVDDDEEPAPSWESPPDSFAPAEETGIDLPTWEPGPGPEFELPTYGDAATTDDEVEDITEALEAETQVDELPAAQEPTEDAALAIPAIELPTWETGPLPDFPDQEEAGETEPVWVDPAEYVEDEPAADLPTFTYEEEAEPIQGFEVERGEDDDPLGLRAHLSRDTAGEVEVPPQESDWLDDIADDEPLPASDQPAEAPAEDLIDEGGVVPDATIARVSVEDVVSENEPVDEVSAEDAATTVAGGAGDVPAAGPDTRDATPASRRPREDDYIDLGALVTEDDDEGTTRFRVQETAPTGDEERDFAELLSQFKSKVQEHLPAEDAAAHYDLGLAFKEMGLIDEAIGEFQVALRAGHMRLRVYEELGDCFLQKEQFNIAEKVLSRALEMKYEDELELLGVYYHLGRAYEALGRRDQARDAYERVLGMDINFGDVSARLARL